MSTYFEKMFEKRAQLFDPMADTRDGMVMILDLRAVFGQLSQGACDRWAAFKDAVNERFQGLVVDNARETYHYIPDVVRHVAGIDSYRGEGREFTIDEVVSGIGRSYDWADADPVNNPVVGPPIRLFDDTATAFLVGGIDFLTCHTLDELLNDEWDLNIAHLSPPPATPRERWQEAGAAIMVIALPAAARRLQVARGRTVRPSSVSLAESPRPARFLVGAPLGVGAVIFNVEGFLRYLGSVGQRFRTVFDSVRNPALAIRSIADILGEDAMRGDARALIGLARLVERYPEHFDVLETALNAQDSAIAASARTVTRGIDATTAVTEARNAGATYTPEFQRLCRMHEHGVESAAEGLARLGSDGHKPARDYLRSHGITAPVSVAERRPHAGQGQVRDMQRRAQERRGRPRVAATASPSQVSSSTAIATGYDGVRRLHGLALTDMKALGQLIRTIKEGESAGVRAAALDAVDKVVTRFQEARRRGAPLPQGFVHLDIRVLLEAARTLEVDAMRIVHALADLGHPDAR